MTTRIPSIVQDPAKNTRRGEAGSVPGGGSDAQVRVCFDENELNESDNDERTLFIDRNPETLPFSSRLGY